ncbi:4-hydroxy-3-methylbut-2-enyl diphosphate reductase [Nocardia sp. NPDC004750]
MTAKPHAKVLTDTDLRKPTTILLASPRSFCAGVQRAIETVERLLDHQDGPVFVRKQIVHNVHVVADLQARGAVFVEEIDQIPNPPPEGAVLVFSAHGVSPAVRAEAAGRGLSVVDATCPLVAKVHAETARFAARGETVILIGHAGHEETEGTLGVAPSATTLIQSVEEVATLDLPADAAVSYVTQTTLATDETAEIITALHARFPTLNGPGSDDICYAATNRQNAVRAIIDDCDVLLVVGSHNSSNSRRLVEVAHRNNTPGYLIDGPEDIDPTWLHTATTIGVTAGASAPPEQVQRVIEALISRGPTQIREHVTTTESIQFTLPTQLKAGNFDPRADRNNSSTQQDPR